MGRQADSLQPLDLEELFTTHGPSNIKNIDLLYRYLSGVHSELLHKKENLSQGATERDIAYLEGQIAGYKIANSIIEAFFDN